MTTSSARLILRTAYLAALTTTVGPGAFNAEDDDAFDQLDAMADEMTHRGTLNGRLATAGSAVAEPPMPRTEPWPEKPTEVQPERAYDAEDEGARGVAGAYQGEGVDPEAPEQGTVEAFKPGRTGVA